MMLRTMFSDADGDIAALVYAAQDRPDAVLCAFARRLADAGRQVCGLVQFRDMARRGSPSRVLVLDRRQVVDVGCRAGTGRDDQCRLDAHWLDDMGGHTEASIRRGVDAAIVNRFGPLEVAGRGFSDAIVAASQTQTPLIVAVPDFEFARWTCFSGGMAVRLDCTIASALSWWRGVSRRGLPAASPRACELLK